jgi:hypothetical protein
MKLHACSSVDLGCHYANTPQVVVLGPALTLCLPNTPLRSGDGDR